MEEKRIILASKSPRRYDLLSELGYEFEVEVSNVDENINEDDPIKLVEEISLKKANAVYKKDKIIIASDTIVTMDNVIFGKPKDKNDAFRMLRKLSGKKHLVISGLCVLYNDYVKVTHDITEVYFKDLNDDLIKEYVDSLEPMDKAGSYAIQGKGSSFVEKFVGSKNNVIGLPTELLEIILKEII